VVVTGMGAITPVGVGLAATWEAVLAGRSGISAITQFDASSLGTRIAGEVRGFVAEDHMDRKLARRLGRYQQFAMAAGEMAMRDAGLVLAPHQAERAAVVVGSCTGGLSESVTAMYATGLSDPNPVSPFFILNVLPNMAASYLSIRHGFKGPCWATNSACATSAHSLGDAMRLIQRDDADVVLAGGAEAPIGFVCMAGFGALRALSTRNDDPGGASRPFDATRDGFVLSEGSAMLVLEELEHARARGARIYAELSGYGSTSDAYHITQPSPDHEGAQRCMQAALRDARLAPAEIHYINAHATSTPLGDVAEAKAIERVFGERAGGIPVSSTKSMMGHLTGAAGAVEACVSILTLTTGMLPPTINLDRLDPDIGLDCVPNVARSQHCDAVMSNSFGFGGTNAVLVFSRVRDAS
jgi:3-oxoacyl-[acyl-carrier-protein] synthase II